jgi:leucyl/phenylalanyl-tRNA---protein transferase
MDREFPAALWDLPDPITAAPGEDLVALGGGLDPGTVLKSYSRGLFPMDVPMAPEMGGGHALGWWSPDPRGVLELDDLRVSRSLAKSCRRFRITFDECFEDVMRACADPNRPQGWITDEFIDAYVRLHDLGFAHSIEVWLSAELVGGLYGVEIGGLFAGESMFHHVRDASKAALVALVKRLRCCPGQRLIDVQWSTPHLASLGISEVSRLDYLRRLPELIVQPSCLG